MVSRISLLAVFFVLFQQVSAQITSSDSIALQKAEKALVNLGTKFINGEEFEERRDANYAFIKTLTSALKTKNSFYYKFPELQMVSTITAPDSTFRLLTWQLETEGTLVRHFGAIQMNTPELKLFPLLDRSDDMERPELSRGNNEQWYGAIYYDIQAVHKGRQTYYMLFGFDSNTIYSNKKIIEPLWFQNDIPVFGEHIIESPIVKERLVSRAIIEYKGDASTSVKYNPDKRMIIFDHLAPISEEYEGIRSYYVPDGTYDAYVWDRNKWIIVQDVVETNMENIRELYEDRRSTGHADDEKLSDEIYTPKD